MQLLAALKKAINVDTDIQHFIDVVYDWVSPMPDSQFKGILPIIDAVKKLPKKFRLKYTDYPYEVYRGTYLSNESYQKLLKGQKLKIKPSSWSKEESEALGFARAWNKPDSVSVLISFTPKAGDILIDLDEMQRDGLFKNTTIDYRRIEDETEILLNEVVISLKNITLVTPDD